MYKQIIFVAIMLTSSFAFSEDSGVQSTESGYITTLTIHNGPEGSSTSQRVKIGLSGTIMDSDCATTGDWVLNLNADNGNDNDNDNGKDNEAAKAQYSFLLASYMAGKEVLLTGNPSETCIAGQEVIRNVSLN